MVIKKDSSLKKVIDKFCTVWEYKGVRKLQISAARIRGRHPKAGWARNKACFMAYYVVRGEGEVNIEGRASKINKGDVVIFKPGEKYFVKGDLDLVIPSSPAWTPEQYEEID